MENNQRNSRKRLNSLILLVAFTTVMLILSTYAWFSAQKNVTIGNLEGTVNVAEGLMVSLDAKNWTQELNLSSATAALDPTYTLQNPYDVTAGESINQNITPTEMLPVSTAGTEYATNTHTSENEIAFYTGVNVNGEELHSIESIDYASTSASDSDYPGFYAIDLFLQNSSKVSSSEQGTVTEPLQLNVNSLLNLKSTGNTATGLQNTVRMAIAMYTPVADTAYATAADTDTKSVYVTANQSQILAAYDGAAIGDVAIWEPNAADHVNYIVINNNTLKLTTAVDALYTASTADGTTGISKYLATEKVPTYALTSMSKLAAQTLTSKDSSGTARTGIVDIYNWNITDAKKWDSANSELINGTDNKDDVTGLERQIALQTVASHSVNNNGTTDNTADDYIVNDYSITSKGVRNLISVKSTGAAIYEIGNEAGADTFDMLKNSIIKCRIYLWLEGQDVDCINYASHGGGVHLDLGLVKSQTAGQQPS